MNITSQNNNWESGNWLAFLFGAVFNLFADIAPRVLLDYTLQAVVGGIVCLCFKLLGDYISDHKKRRRP
jgi:hypothetical protein